MTELLKKRFEANMERHPGLSWEDVASLLERREIREAVQKMEETGGEPDVVVYEGKLLVCDCVKESVRRSLCYDEAARLARKKTPPASSAQAEAEKMGVRLMTEGEYRYLQTLGLFDLKTSSWIRTPERIRRLGGALFCERRYDTVFTFHNGAESYYSVRGFRAVIELE